MAILHDLGRTLVEMGYHVEAEQVYRHVLTVEPDGAFLTNSDMLLNFNYRADIRAETLLVEARAYGQKAERMAKPHRYHPNDCNPERRLRVGLVSCDLGMHSVGFFLLNVMASIDPDKLELYAFEIGKRKDPINERLRQHIPFWRDIAGPKLTDEAAADLIRDDRIDILIDLNGHTGDNRLPVFAWKPAPVQLTWLGYLGSTGLNARDYILADRYALPPGEEAHFVEKPWRMPGSYICFSPPTVPVDVGALPALRNGYVTFGSFNNLNKINEQVVACWAGVLQAVPGSKLYLKTKNLGGAETRAKVIASFARHDIPEARLLLEGAIPNHEEHFRAYQKVDIALDPYPYPGITTSVEALWMGVPVLSMKGDRFISHQGESILNNVGLPEWIASDKVDYVAKAVAFAGDLPALDAVRMGL
ncbi:MAG: hypothetical protein Q8M35_10845, partial [Pseudohongiella sp.]|nr:hypothetical protein [Pseudohongiella sp.]